MNSENIKASKPHVLILTLLIKKIYKEEKKALLYQILVHITH